MGSLCAPRAQRASYGSYLSTECRICRFDSLLLRSEQLLRAASSKGQRMEILGGAEHQKARDTSVPFNDLHHCLWEAVVVFAVFQDRHCNIYSHLCQGCLQHGDSPLLARPCGHRQAPSKRHLWRQHRHTLTHTPLSLSLHCNWRAYRCTSWILAGRSCMVSQECYQQPYDSDYSPQV